MYRSSIELISILLLSPVWSGDCFFPPHSIHDESFEEEYRHLLDVYFV